MKRQTSNIIAILYTKEVIIAAIALVAIGVHLILRFGVETTGTVFGFPSQAIPLLVALTCGTPLVFGLVIHLSRLEFSSDLLAGISIVTSVILGEYLAGTLVVLMLSGGQALEAFAVRRASFALEALASGCHLSHTASRMGVSATYPLPRSRSATHSWSSRTRLAPSMVSCSKAEAP